MRQNDLPSIISYEICVRSVFLNFLKSNCACMTRLKFMACNNLLILMKWPDKNVTSV